MGDFCKYCGKPLENGMCDCEEFKKANVETPKQEEEVKTLEVEKAPEAAPEAVPEAAPVRQNVNAQPKISPETKAKLKELFKACFELTGNVIKKPQEAIGISDANKDKTAPLVMGGIHLILLFLLTWIHIPGLGKMLKAGGRAQIGFFLMLAVAIGILSATLFSFLFEKKGETKRSFVAVLANFCVATIPGTILFVCSFIFGLFSVQIASVLLLLTFLAWILFSQEAVDVSLKESGIGLWVNMLAILVGVIVISLIANGLLKNVIAELMNPYSYFF